MNDKLVRKDMWERVEGTGVDVFYGQIYSVYSAYILVIQWYVIICCTDMRSNTCEGSEV